MRSAVEQPPANAADGIASARNASLCDNNVLPSRLWRFYNDN
ncbi:hypothetical protein [uncultured Duncaniella sp.]|nr:hypothetical protein [uncultured Duncaniella sp.]